MAIQDLVRMDRQQEHALFASYSRSKDPALRGQLVLGNLWRAAYLARTFAGRGEPVDDLAQVAALGLLKAVDRYDPTRGVQFSTYATVTIVGEIRRHFRDKCWAIRVSRGLRELNQHLMRSRDRLVQELGRMPSVGEMARDCGVGLDRAIEALNVGGAYNPVSLDAQVESEEGTGGLGVEDPAFQQVEDRVSLERAVRCLPERLQVAIRLRYHQGLRQAEVSRRLGWSQMAVSRAERQALEALRAFLQLPRDGPVAAAHGGAQRNGNGHAGNGNGGESSPPSGAGRLRSVSTRP